LAGGLAVDLSFRPEASLGRILTGVVLAKPQAGNADVFASVTGVHDGMPLTGQRG
jgi:hypothetical protein